jgi:hypothetical protein
MESAPSVKSDAAQLSLLARVIAGSCHCWHASLLACASVCPYYGHYFEYADSIHVTPGGG